MIYLGFESILVTHINKKQNQDRSHVNKYQNCDYGYNLKCVDDQFTSLLSRI